MTPYGAFRAPLVDALEEWDAHFPRAAKQKKLPPNGLHSDVVRADLLRHLRESYALNFGRWIPMEVFVYCSRTLPRSELVRLTREGQASQFLAVLYDGWDPSFHDWMQALWVFCGRAHEFFGDLVFLLPEKQRPEPHVMGRVLFKDVQLSREAAADVAGALIKWPDESTFAIPHSKQIFHLSKQLSAGETGYLCRSLILYRVMLRCKCQCGYEEGEESCQCGRLDFSLDQDKEYARALYGLILADHVQEKLRLEDRWSQSDRDEFIVNACEYVFSEPAYKEIYQHLQGGQMPTRLQKHSRKLTDWEVRNNVYRSADGDYDSSMAQHSGCIVRGCKQMTKKECANVACKTHCCQIGMQDCRGHRHYPKRPKPPPWRKSIKCADL